MTKKAFVDKRMGTLGSFEHCNTAKLKKFGKHCNTAKKIAEYRNTSIPSGNATDNTTLCMCSGWGGGGGLPYETDGDARHL